MERIRLFRHRCDAKTTAASVVTRDRRTVLPVLPTARMVAVAKTVRVAKPRRSLCRFTATECVADRRKSFSGVLLPGHSRMAIIYGRTFGLCGYKKSGGARVTSQLPFGAAVAGLPVDYWLRFDRRRPAVSRQRHALSGTMGLTADSRRLLYHYRRKQLVHQSVFA